MLKCPRCNLPQEETPQCRYCGLIFEENRAPSGDFKAARRRRIALGAAVFLLAAAALLTYDRIGSSRPENFKKAANIESPKIPAPLTEEDDLHKTVQELSGYEGILNHLVGGSSQGGIIATVVFSIIGMGYLTYGKKSKRLMLVICGAVLMSYPYFIGNTMAVILIGTGLSILPFMLGGN